MTTHVAHATAVDALAELARQVRKSTLDLLRVPHASWLIWAPRGTSNHILWHAGHALWLQDALTVRPLTAQSDLPPRWEQTFGQNSRPDLVSQWPSEAEVRNQLENQLTRIARLLSDKTEFILNDPHATPRGGGWPLLEGMIHGWHDEARHQGEMYLLHKLMRAE
jgi:hypothetical protein